MRPPFLIYMTQPLQSNQPVLPIADRDATVAGGGPVGKPQAGLGANFERPALRPLALRARAAVWGDAPPEGAKRPVEPVWADLGELRSEVLRTQDFRCSFCDFRSTSNEINCLNGNHRDLSRENLKVACPSCNRWQHLDDLAGEGAHIAYLPDVAQRDLSHLYRTIVVALGSDDAELRRDAKALLNWMASHNQYVQDAWGTSSAAAFGTALRRLEADDEVKRALALDGLAMVMAPGHFDSWAPLWRSETLQNFPTADWASVHHAAMNPPK